MFCMWQTIHSLSCKNCGVLKCSNCNCYSYSSVELLYHFKTKHSSLKHSVQLLNIMCSAASKHTSRESKINIFELKFWNYFENLFLNLKYFIKILDISFLLMIKPATIEFNFSWKFHCKSIRKSFITVKSPRVASLRRVCCDNFVVKRNNIC